MHTRRVLAFVALLIGLAQATGTGEAVSFGIPEPRLTRSDAVAISYALPHTLRPRTASDLLRSVADEGCPAEYPAACPGADGLPNAGCCSEPSTHYCQDYQGGNPSVPNHWSGCVTPPSLEAEKHFSDSCQIWVTC